MTSDPTAKTSSAATSTGTRPRRSAIRPISGSIATYPSRKPETIGAPALQLLGRDADAGHHVRQRQHDDVGVGGGERDGDSGEPQDDPRLADHGAVISFSVP